MKGARGLLINITGGSDITLFEIDQAANRIKEEVDEDANIMVGMALDESLVGQMRISVVATGIDSAAPSVSQMPKFQVVGGGMADSVAFPPQAHTQNPPSMHAPLAHETQAMGQSAAMQGAGYIPQPPAKPLLSAAYQGEAAELALNEPEMRKAAAPPARAGHPMPPASAQPNRAQPEAPKRSSLFSRVFGSTPAAPSSGQRPHQEPVISQTAYRQEPAGFDQNAESGHRDAAREPARAAVRPAQIDEIGLEIPAFLRRSSN